MSNACNAREAAPRARGVFKHVSMRRNLLAQASEASEYM